MLFGTAVLGIIAAALIVPWYFMELLAEQGLQRPAEELSRMRVREWIREHPTKERRHLATDAHSTVVQFATAGREDQVKGPYLVLFSPDFVPSRELDPPAKQAAGTFINQPDRDQAMVRTTSDAGEAVYRYFHAIRAESSCTKCHNASMKPVVRQFQQGQLVGMVDLALPKAAASSELVTLTRFALAIGGGLATLLAFFLFAAITQRLVLRPVSRLRKMADDVTEGDLSVRSELQTGDELQRLGESFNEMLEAIEEQTERLRAANRALDLKLNEVAEANVTLFQANTLKSEFVANISHELRTPLNSILGFADLLGESDEPRVRRWGGNISSAARNLLNMINDMLDLARIEAGRADVRFDKVSVSDTCQTLLALMKPLADKRQLELVSDIDGDLPLIVTDGGKLQQILYNLLSNAVKFTPAEGTVTLSAHLRPTFEADEEPSEITLSVRDTGPGIPESEQQHIFEKFYQVDRSLTRSSSGTGLGLAISKELTQLLKGRLTLDSQPGRGTTFTLVLPIDPTGQNA
ncbi:MAG: ATP-binding protein [Phycisphaerae bacterium]